jgi:hypothetical protein
MSIEKLNTQKNYDIYTHIHHVLKHNLGANSFNRTQGLTINANIRF